MSFILFYFIFGQDLILKFYNCAWLYVALFEESLEKTPVFKWTYLYPVSESIEIEKVYSFEAFKFSEMFKSSRDNLFTQFCLRKIFVENRYSIAIKIKYI